MYLNAALFELNHLNFEVQYASNYKIIASWSNDNITRPVCDKENCYNVSLLKNAYVKYFIILNYIAV